MSFNEKQTICPICNEKLSFIKQTLNDKTKVCEKHFNEAGITMSEILSRINGFAIEEIRERINELNKSDSFVVTKMIGHFVAFDDENKLVIISPKKKKNRRIYDYSQISKFELMEDGQAVTSGGLGRALVGGALFGGAGAIVGGVTGGKKTKEKISSLRIKISLKDINHPVDYIDFLDLKTKKGSIIYKDAYNKAQECLSALQFICDQQVVPQDTKSSESAADEILKYKNLLDAGAITEEEYNLKKKELLGI